MIIEKILCAAIHIDNDIEYPYGQQCISGCGFVVAGFSHDEIRKAINAVEIKKSINCVRIVQTDGFLTTLNRFVSRRTAADIAFKARQIKKETFELISTDLLEKE